MLPMLQPVLESRKRIVSVATVLQFEKLLQQFGGHKERQRWQALQETFTTFHPDISIQSQKIATESQANSAQAAAPEDSQTCTFAYSAGRVARLIAIADAQKQVFALGDDQHALTVTANSKACEFAARQGVQLEVFIHRAVWLTGK